LDHIDTKDPLFRIAGQNWKSSKLNCKLLGNDNERRPGVENEYKRVS